MPNIFQTAAIRPQSVKPRFGTPLASASSSLRDRLVFASLCNEGGGARLQNLVTRAMAALPTGPLWTPDGLLMTPSTLGVPFNVPKQGLDDLALGPFSYAALVRADAASAQGGLAAVHDAGTFTSGWQISCNQGITGLTIERVTTFLDAATTAATVPGRPTWVVVTYAGDLIAANVRIYYDAVPQTLTTVINGAGAQTTDAGRPFVLGQTLAVHFGQGINAYRGIILAAYIWRRALSWGEVLSLQSNPFPFFDPRPLVAVPIITVTSGAATGGFPALFLDL